MSPPDRTRSPSPASPAPEPATVVSPLSRDRAVGEDLGRSTTVDEAARATNQTAEDVNSLRTIRTWPGNTVSRCRSPRSSP
ncbi:hypothetical protein ABZ341_37875 [Streptomyces sp. NPDC006173]|uniref:hypothetical protein n=1 Tax=Streptomyces sp. NPDC006173 TaxID=3155349 RepID=UPI00340FE83F